MLFRSAHRHPRPWPGAQLLEHDFPGRLRDSAPLAKGNPTVRGDGVVGAVAGAAAGMAGGARGLVEAGAEPIAGDLTEARGARRGM